MWGRRHVCLVLHVVGCSKPPCLSRSKEHLHLCCEPTQAQMWSENMFSIQDKNYLSASEVERTLHLNMFGVGMRVVWYTVLYGRPVHVSICIYPQQFVLVLRLISKNLWHLNRPSIDWALVRKKSPDHSNKLHTLTVSFHRRTLEQGWKCWSEIKLGNQNKEFQNSNVFTSVFYFCFCLGQQFAQPKISSTQKCKTAGYQSQRLYIHTIWFFFPIEVVIQQTWMLLNCCIFSGCKDAIKILIKIILGRLWYWIYRMTHKQGISVINLWQKRYHILQWYYWTKSLLELGQSKPSNIFNWNVNI